MNHLRCSWMTRECYFVRQMFVIQLWKVGNAAVLNALQFKAWKKVAGAVKVYQEDSGPL